MIDRIRHFLTNKRTQIQGDHANVTSKHSFPLFIFIPASTKLRNNWLKRVVNSGLKFRLNSKIVSGAKCRLVVHVQSNVEVSTLQVFKLKARFKMTITMGLLECIHVMSKPRPTSYWLFTHTLSYVFIVGCCDLCKCKNQQINYEDVKC